MSGFIVSVHTYNPPTTPPTQKPQPPSLGTLAGATHTSVILCTVLIFVIKESLPLVVNATCRLIARQLENIAQFRQR